MSETLKERVERLEEAVFKDKEDLGSGESPNTSSMYSNGYPPLDQGEPHRDSEECS